MVMSSGSICIPGNHVTVGGEEAQVGYPGNKAVSHILRQLLILLQLFEEDAARGEKGQIRHLCTADPLSARGLY